MNSLQYIIPLPPQDIIDSRRRALIPVEKNGKNPFFSSLFCSNSIFDINASNNSNLPLASKIIVKNLSFSTSQSHLASEFSKYGRIAEVKLVEDKATKKPKGYAFIQYTSQEEAMLALESMDHQFFDGRTLFVDIAKPRKSDFGDYPKASGPPQEHMVIEGANND